MVTAIDRDANDYTAAIWLARADGSAPPVKLTSGRKRDTSPRWSPDGTKIAFTSTRDKDQGQLYVIPVAGGEPTKLTDLTESVTDPIWSPDGSRIAFTSRVRDAAYDEEDEHKRAPRRFTRLQFKLDNEGWTGDRRRHLFVVAADGSDAPIQLTDGDFEDAEPTWSPDGARIAFTSSRDDDWDVRDITDIYVVDASGSDPARLTPGDGTYSLPSWSPDGSTIAALWAPGIFDWPRHARLATLDPGTGARTVLTEDLDRNCAPYPSLRAPCWQDERTILFGIEDGGNTHLYRVQTDGKPEAVIDEEGTVVGFDSVGDTIATARTSPVMLPELFIGDERVTDLTSSFPAPLIAPQRFTATSADGSLVDAWFVPPHGLAPGERAPLLLSIHGGPFTQYGNRFFDEFQVYADAGYAVVYSNPRGSSGYSEEWGRAIRGPGEAGPGMGTVDHEDLMAVVDEALQRFDICDRDRLGVIGGSYGGYMTSWIISHTDRFKAAISERAVNSWVSMWGSSDIGWAFKGYVGVDVLEDHDAWRRMSPLTYAESIHTPLMILHSENDLRCNIEQGEQLFTTLRLLGREVEMVRFPAEGHELSRSGAPAHRVMRFEIIMEFFDRHLKG